jgi:hypothetical protein
MRRFVILFTLSISVFVDVTFPSAVTPKKNSVGSESVVGIQSIKTSDEKNTQTNKNIRKNKTILRLKKKSTLTFLQSILSNPYKKRAHQLH